MDKNQHQLYPQRIGKYLIFTFIMVIIWCFIRMSCLMQANQINIEAIYSGQYLYLVEAAWLFGLWLLISVPMGLHLVVTPSSQNVIIRLRNSTYCRMSAYLVAAYWIGKTVYFIADHSGFNGMFQDLNYVSQSLDILFLWVGGILIYSSCCLLSKFKEKAMLMGMGVGMTLPTGYILLMLCL